jgi:hypothetical protein
MDGIAEVVIAAHEALFDLLNFTIPVDYLFQRAFKAICPLQARPIHMGVLIQFQFLFLEQTLPEHLTWVYNRWHRALSLMRREGKYVFDEEGELSKGGMEGIQRKGWLLVLETLGNLRRQRVHVCLIFLAVALGCNVPVLDAVYRRWNSDRPFKLDPIDRMPTHYRHVGEEIQAS